MKAIERVRRAVAEAGLRWDALLADTEEVILFGSYAAGCDSPSSDIDLICVGEGRRIATKTLHMIWIAPKTIRNRDWLTTEIGGHVMRYGQWLKGTNPFSNFEPASSKAVARKLLKIADRAGALGQRWDRLSSAYRHVQTLKLRRDVQRLAILKSGDAVPPSPMLDSSWAIQTGKSKWISSVLSCDQPLSKLAVEIICERRVLSRRLSTVILSESIPRYFALHSGT
jgi:hypothetical protein